MMIPKFKILWYRQEAYAFVENNADKFPSINNHSDVFTVNRIIIHFV